MKSMLCTLALVLSAPAFGYFLDGNDLLGDMREWERSFESGNDANYLQASRYSSYLMGIYDALELSGSICPANVTLGDAGDVVASFLRDNAARLTEPAFILVQDALIDAYPCEEQRD